MNVRLNRKVESIIQEKIRTGRYGSATEVVDAALRLLEQRDEVREKIAVGLQSLREGKGIGENSAFDELRSRHDKYKRTKRS